MYLGVNYLKPKQTLYVKKRNACFNKYSANVSNLQYLKLFIGKEKVTFF